MAAPSNTVWGSVVGLDSKRYAKIGIYSSVTNTSTKSTVNVDIWFWSRYSVDDSNNKLYYDVLASSDGSATTNKGSVAIKTTNISGDGWSTSNQIKLKSYSYEYTRGTSDITRYVKTKLTNVDRVGKDMYVSSSFKVPKLVSYTIKYDANGGSGAPSNQTKWYGIATTISSTKPTRTGYVFQGWATSSNGSVAYASGASYTENSAITLYAVWKANTYTVSYNANGGSGAPSSQTKTYGVNLTLSTTEPTMTNYTFKGWGTSSSATTVSYSAGASYTSNASITLYAIWELAYIKPRINKFSVTRMKSVNGVAVESEDGTIGWGSLDCEADIPITVITIKWKSNSESTWHSKTITGNIGTSYKSNSLLISTDLDSETTYNICVEVNDGTGTTSKTIILPSKSYSMDFLNGGKGVAFGKAAEIDDTAEFEFDAKFNKPVYGKALGMDRLPAIPENSDLNNYIEPGCYAVYSDAISDTCTNIPIKQAGRLEVWSSTGEGIQSKQWSYLRQRYIPYNNKNAIYERDMSRNTSNAWSYGAWWKSGLSLDSSNLVYEYLNSLKNDYPKLLWGDESKSSGYYMTETHTANLTENISSQPNGIVLVFSVYKGSNDDMNTGFNTFFVSKRTVSKHPSVGHNFFMTGWAANNFYVGLKYLYIYDNKIVGNKNNNSATTQTGNGITITNSKFVLRYVYGV